VVFIVALDEAAQAAVAQSSLIDYGALIAELVNASDATGVLPVFSSNVSELARAQDTALAQFLWNIINDSQSVSWQNINTAETSNWQVINTADGTQWQVIKTQP
jgi:hypothetical protein